MLYVEESLNPNEEIIHIGEFHWFYTFNAALWIVIGVAGMAGILYAGYYADIFLTVRESFVDLPDQLMPQAWAEVKAAKGGTGTP